MHTRRGFTLAELLVAMVLLLIVGVALSRVLIRSMRVSQAQMVQADMQSNVRTGALVLPLELREIGFDSNIYVSPPGPAAINSDIESIGVNTIQFRAGRGFSTVCYIDPTLAEWRVRKPVYGIRGPAITDRVQLYVENDENTGVDDQWVRLTVLAIDNNAKCGAEEAISFIVDPNIIVGPGPLGPRLLTASSVKINGPLRWAERMRFGSYVDADGLTYLGAWSLSAPDFAYRAVAGPIDPATGLQFRYFDRNEVEVVPGVGNINDVRAVEVTINGQTRDRVSLSGSSTRLTRTMQTRTQVALRNTLK
jgi:prepilin-type N-terminal cleavage/methylation domain-containing protein